MADTNPKITPNAGALPDWWAREKRRRQLWTLIFLLLLLTLIGIYYWISRQGVVGSVEGVNFDTVNYIAFVRQDKKGETSLYAIRADGSDLRRLTPADDKSNKADPAWTIDGKSLLYASNRNDSSRTQIYLLGGGSPVQLTYGTGSKFAPVASPDGKRVAFVTQGAVKTVNLNGTDVYQVMPVPRAGNGQGDDPAAAAKSEMELPGPFRTALFSSDGRGLAGVQDLSVEEGITAPPGVVLGDQVAQAIPSNGSKAKGLDMGREVSLAWEPNGNRLAASYTELQTTDRAGQPVLLSGIRIWSFENPEQPKATDLLVSRGFNLTPKNIAWSPDGALIAFEGWQLKGAGERELRGVIVMDASKSVALATPEQAKAIGYMAPAAPEGRPQRPRWSPDGTRLLFEIVRPDGGTDLAIINADGTNRINLTKGEGSNSQAVWSPQHK